MKERIERAVFLLATVVAVLSACRGDSQKTSAGDVEAPLPPSELETQLPSVVRAVVLKPWSGDLDSMVKRRVVRVGTTYNRSFYFVDRGVQRGVVYEYGQLMAERLNKHFKTGDSNQVHIVFLPLPREVLLPALAEGKVDMVAAQLTVTPELRKRFDFSDPARKNVSKVLVTGPSAPTIASVYDLSGQDVFARAESGGSDSLRALNESFRSEKKSPMVIREPPPGLEDDDLLEMVNAGLIPAILVDDYLAAFWKRVFTKLVVHDSIVFAAGGSLAVAVRKQSPQLVSALNTFMGKYGLGTAFGNQVERKYLVNTTYAANATSMKEREKFLAVVNLFRKYGDQYQMDFLLMAAQGYQESQLRQEARSRVGAIGVMQIMPATGKSLKVGDITKLEPNIHGGVKYIRGLRDTYFANEPMDDLNKGLFTFAAYNAGPGRVRQLRKLAGERGLNPNVWFGNVEQVASERIGRETVTYVANIFKYYIAYRLVAEEAERRAAAKAAAQEK